MQNTFTHRGYTVRLRTYDDGNASYLIPTILGPVFATAPTILEARRRAIEWVNGATAVQHTDSHGDDFGSISSFCRDTAEA